MKTLSKEGVMINKETIDLRYVEQITDSEQVTALGYCMRYAQKHILDGRKDLRQVVEELERDDGQRHALGALREQLQHLLHGDAQEAGDLSPALTATED